MAFRGVGKSYVTAAFVIWLLYRDPTLNIGVVSATGPRAERFTRFCLNIIRECPWLQHMRPGRNDPQSTKEFAVAGSGLSQSASVTSYSITGQITGARADVVIFDDVEVPGNSETQHQRDKLAEKVKEAAALLKPKGRIIYLGTPQCEDSLYATLPDRGYQIRIWPVLYPAESWMQHNGANLAPLLKADMESGAAKPGQITETERFTEYHVQATMLEYGRAGFALQFMLDTSLSDADRYPLRLSDLIIHDLSPDEAPDRLKWTTDPRYREENLPIVGMRGDRYFRGIMPSAEHSPYTGRILAFDPSGRGKDEAAYAVVFCLHGMLFLMDAGALPGDSGYGEEALTELANIAKRWKVNGIVMESNFGDGAVAALLKPILSKIHPCSIEEVRHSKQKEKRIVETLEPVLRTHRLVVNRQVIVDDYESTQGMTGEHAFRRQLFWQLTRLTTEKGCLPHDDRLDALSMAVAYWQVALEADPESAAARAAEERYEELIQSHLATLDRQSGPPSTLWDDC